MNTPLSEGWAYQRALARRHRKRQVLVMGATVALVGVAGAVLGAALYVLALGSAGADLLRASWRSL